MRSKAEALKVCGLEYRHKFFIMFIALLSLATCLLTISPAMAGATVPRFGSLGVGPGEFNEPKGVAFDQATGDFYVVDRNNQRIDEFTSEGSFIAAWGWGVEDEQAQFEVCTTKCVAGQSGNGSGQFDFPQGVAVDNDPLSLSYGDLYVVDVRNNRVEKFSSSGTFLLMFGGEVDEANQGNVCEASEKCQGGTFGTSGNGVFAFDHGQEGDYIAVGPDGTVYVGDENRVQEFTSAGIYSGEVNLAGQGNIVALAVDGSGNIYVRSSSASFIGVRKYNASGVLLSTFDAVENPGNSEGATPTTVALDASGDLFIDDEGADGIVHHILEYNTVGEEIASFDAGQEDGLRGLAWNSFAEDLLVLNQNNSTFEASVRIVGPPRPGPLVLPGSEAATEIGFTTAGLRAKINPEGGVTTYRFEYGETASYGSSAPISAATLAGGFGEEPVEAAVTGLMLDTLYHYRVVAESEGHVSRGEDQIFITLPAVLIDSESFEHVTSDSATLTAQLNPLGVDARYRIEYGKSATYESSTPEASIEPTTTDVVVSTHAQSLLPGTTYHYRVVAHDEREGIEYVVAGADQRFTTEAVDTMFTLPDDRAWEMVSPPDKHAASLHPIGEGEVIQASVEGSAFTYVASLPTEPAPLGYANFVQVLSVRGDAGWSSHDIATAHGAATSLSIDKGQEYRFFTEDLSLSLVEPRGEFYPLSEFATERTPYLRRQELCASELASSECYLPLVTSKEGRADVPSGVEFGKNPHNEQGAVRYVGGTPDLHHVILESDEPLTSTPAEGQALYEWSLDKPPGEELQLVSLPPEGEGVTGVSATLGHQGTATANAVSDDGSRIVWTKGGGEAYLYMRDTAKEKTVRLDVVQPGAVGNGGIQPIFQAASRSGSMVFFTDTQQLTGDAGKTGADLYLCEVVEKSGVPACNLSDLTPEDGQERAKVLGMVGSSEDGAVVYFVANGVLSSTSNALDMNAEPGQDNLYMRHYDSGTKTWGATQFIDVLSGEDSSDWASVLAHRTAEIASNAEWLTFVSDMPLTGYDNVDAGSGRRDEEVFLYNSLSGRLVCASCDPSGARPVGLEYGEESLLTGGFKVLEPKNWFAAIVPGWTPFALNMARYQSRYLSDSGRLFFDSNDALVPQDINGTEDVYEYEPVGVSDCTESYATFSEGSDGCVSLISSGTSSEESAFLDASEGGGNVFFLTAAKLSSQDFDTSLDVYDARVCTSSSPCIAPGEVAGPCLDVDSCRSAPLPQPSVFGSPASGTFSGAGNVVGTALKSTTTSKSLTRAQKLSRALKTCRKKKRKQRSTCERKARKQYGTRKINSGKATKRRKG